jgi:hypothetical protein
MPNNELTYRLDVYDFDIAGDKVFQSSKNIKRGGVEYI